MSKAKEEEGLVHRTSEPGEAVLGQAAAGMGESASGYWTRLFDCVICKRGITDFPWRNGRERHLAPICRYCEGEYSERAPTAGAFMDRRVACRLSAIAHALHGTASIMDWERRYARA